MLGRAGQGERLFDWCYHSVSFLSFISVWSLLSALALYHYLVTALVTDCLHQEGEVEEERINKRSPPHVRECNLTPS